MVKVKPTIKRKLVRVEVQSLRIHPTAQRQIVPSQLKKLVAKMDLDKIGVLQAIECSIDGVHGIWVIDGQHRVRALLDLGFGEWTVDVCIHTDVQSPARASEVFLGLNDRASVQPFDKFTNRVRALDPIAVGALARVEDHGLTVDRSVADGHVCCVSSLMSLYGLDGGASLSLALGTIIAAWGRTAAALEGKLLFGIGLLYNTYNGSIDTPGLVKKLAKYPGGASAVIGDAKSIARHRKMTLPRCIAGVILESYNSGRRTGKLDPL
jgi:hypothetical protein